MGNNRIHSQDMLTQSRQTVNVDCDNYLLLVCNRRHKTKHGTQHTVDCMD